jgi:MFS family permease
LITEATKRFIGLSSFQMLAFFRRGLFYAYLSIYLRLYLGLSVTETTLFATLPMTLNILAQSLVWGRLSDRLQLRRSLIITGEILAAAGTMGVYYLHRMAATPRRAGYAIIIGLTVLEIFWSMSNIAWSALVSDLYSSQARSRIQGRLYSMGGIGRMAGVWIGGLLYDGLGAHFAGWGFAHGALFKVSAGVMLLSTIPLFFLPEGGVPVPAAEHQPAAGGKADKGDRIGLYLVFLIAMVFINFGRNSIAIIMPQYLSLGSGLDLSSRMLSNIINTQSLAIITVGWIAGWISRKLGEEITMAAGTLCAIFALLLLWRFTTLPVLYLSSFLRGVADVTLMAAAYTYASLLIPAQLRAQRFAWFNATFFLSFGLAGTLIAGPVVDLLVAAGRAPAAAYRVSFAAAAAVTLIGLFILAGLVLYRRRKRRALRGASESSLFI